MNAPISPDDTVLTASDAAEFVGLSLAGFWRGVSAGRFPNPVYPASAAPRWFRSELRAALEATRANPSETKVARRMAARRAARPAGEAA